MLYVINACLFDLSETLFSEMATILKDLFDYFFFSSDLR